MGTRFAFDIGTNSIGWAVWRTGPDLHGVYGPDAPLELLDAGVRLFKDGRNPKDGKSLAEMRRGPRQARKRRDRFVLRRDELSAALIHAGLMPADAVQRGALSGLDPYLLRAKALDEALTPHELGRAIFHLNQRRGFRSNRRADRKDGEKGKIRQAAEALREGLRATGSRTLGEFLWLRHRNPELRRKSAAVEQAGRSGKPDLRSSRLRLPTRIRLDGQGAKALYAFYPTRDMVADEFDELWRRQAVHHPSLLTPQARDCIRAILFRQRPLEPPPVGRCTFVPDEERAPKAFPSVQAREIYERLAHLRLSTGPMADRPLRPEERDVLASVLLNEDRLTFVKMRKALKLGGDVKINIEETGESELTGLRTNRILAKDDHYGPAWRGLPLADKDAFVAKLIDVVDEEALIARLMAENGLTRATAEACAAVPLPEGYSRLGRTANAAVLDALRTQRDESGFVVPYAEAVRRAGARLGRDWHHSDLDIRSGMPAPARIPPLAYYAELLQRHVLPGSMDPKDTGDDAKYWGRINNPTVHIGLNQLRRVVNRLVAVHGHPDQIVVELARELKQTEEQRRREQQRNRENRTENDRRARELESLGIPSTGETRARLKLFEEQQRTGRGVAQCPFSGRPIGLEKLFGAEIEVEHILPRSRTLDDSAANKVLCYRDMNRIKRGKTPFEAFGMTPDWQDIAARAEGLPPSKRWRFKPDAMARFEGRAAGSSDDAELREMGLDSGFLARQLNETRYLSRLARAYLHHACVRRCREGGLEYGDVYVTPGTLVGLLRGKWGLNTLLSDDNRKERTDHRHHALDAIVIGAMTRGWLNHLAREAGRAEATEYDAVLGQVPWPFERFRDAVRDQLVRFVVSNKPEHDPAGALHEDTAYGLVRDPAEAAVIGNLVRRKPVADLTPGEVDAVRDAALRRSLRERVAPFRDVAGKMSDEKGFKAALTAFAAENGLRRVRIGKEDASAVAMTERQTGLTYKAVVPGENAHIDIVAMRDGSWKGFAATLIEVNRPGWRPQWERDRLGGKLVMRLRKGDMVELESERGGRVVKTVQQLWMKQNLVVLAEHREGGDLQKRHRTDNEIDPFRWDFANIGKLRQRGCVAVRVDEIGRVSRRRTNV
ncbi:type II CRISPR RNA-guided endonuclease Cas9 [Labrys wisconsinensis]|uniref:CRISPR-associated endonuclease Cas9 n=1 Tax=Labrys wisconsinensis TaxID=425677 RepID=A0ABU0J089_9HYPH|nr:type II CRISPR RNA-guided endonuclease Cas9 [Labrys wisconsinensis]MDQ0467680.1 CRISPR-associated endonuclease Csn1 [Labrys wisconsinensis]